MRKGQQRLSSGRRSRAGEHFGKYPHALVRHPAFTTLMRPALMALIGVTSTHFEGGVPNNGALHLTRHEAKQFCIKCRRDYCAAIWELKHRGLLFKTSQGGLGGNKKRRDRYAVTWLPMDEASDGVFYDDHVHPWTDPPNSWMTFSPEQTVPHWSAANPYAYHKMDKQSIDELKKNKSMAPKGSAVKALKGSAVKAPKGSAVNGKRAARAALKGSARSIALGGRAAEIVSAKDDAERIGSGP